MGKRGLKKQEILKTSANLFMTKQYDRVTYDDIEKEVNVTRGAILYYFTNKQAIFDEVMAQYFPDFMRSEVNIEALIEHLKKMKKKPVHAIMLASNIVTIYEKTKITNK